jgi:agmatinase
VGAILMAVPSDTGAGIMRGANFGPLGIREAFLARYGTFPKSLVDVGDVVSVPQLLHDEMLSDRQIAATRKELYGAHAAEALPVSPLSIAEQVLYALYELNPEAQIFLLGGDHSVSWPAMLYCHRRCGDDFGVLHFDAHTDLLEHRLGIRYCYTTWAWHALKLLKPQRMVQVGLRTSGKPKEYWMEKYPVVQIWAHEVMHREKEVTTRILQHFAEQGVRRIYISNDIDGTDASAASATGTPESGGLTPAFVKNLISQLRQEFAIIGGDIVEVAPPLSGRRDFAEEPTCQLAAEYLKEMFAPER